MSTDDEDDEEDVPLNIHHDSLVGDGGSPHVATKDSDRRDIGHFIEGEEEDDGDAGCATYGHQFRMGRYSGYCTLGRVSLHDSWDCADGDSDANGDSLSPADGDEDRKHNHGGFVSFWRQKDGGDPSSSGGRERRALPLILGRTNQEFHTADDDDCDDDRVETTMRPIPLFYRGYHGGLEQSTGLDAPANSFGLWFKRELGITNLHFTEVGEPEFTTRRRRRRRNTGDGPWNLWKRRESSDVEDFENAEDEGGDANSLISSSSSDEILWRGMTNQVPKDYVNAKNHENSIFGGQIRRGGGVLALPIIRPFLRGSRKGFTDNSDLGQPSNEMGNEEDDDGADYADGLPSRRDRAAVIESISQGIVGTTDDSLLIDANCGDDTQSTIESRTPIWLERIFVTRFFQGFGNQHKNSAIIQLHNLLRKEDWSLATTLLQTKPELAQTWYCINRLYGGKYDGEALPIHAASALCPPPSFIEMLGELYPEGLLEKDKAFGRVPLHVACRCVASSSVIRVLCEMEPKCVVERDDLKRVPLHYLLKNYCSFGDDDDDDTRIDGSTVHCIQEEEGDEDGMIALKILLNTDPGCVHAADHRGWLPLHVACGSSSHKGMLHVLSLLLKIWPESLLVKTDKDSDALACVDMAGKHHPTKARVLALLQEAKCKVNVSDAGNDVVSIKGGDNDESEQVESNKQIDESHEESFHITSPSPSRGQMPDDNDDELLDL